MSREANITEADGFFKGEAKNLAFDIDDGLGSGEDMTGWNVDLYVRRRGATAEVVITKSNLSIGDGLDPDGVAATGNRATAQFGQADTLNIPAGSYFYTVERVDAGFEQVLVYGTLELLGRPTH